MDRCLTRLNEGTVRKKNKVWNVGTVCFKNWTKLRYAGTVRSKVWDTQYINSKRTVPYCLPRPNVKASVSWPKFYCFFFSMFEKCWKHGKGFFAYCFVDLKKAYDCLSNFIGLCRRMALMVSWYTPLSHSMVPTAGLWLGKWQAIKAFHVGVELWRE